MTAYVAGRFGDWRIIREVQAALRAAGCTITYDWTVHAERGESERDGSMTRVAMAAAAGTDLAAAWDADLFVLVCEGDMADAIGCYIEFGAAAAAGATLHVIAPPRPSIFWCLPAAVTFPDRESWVSAVASSVGGAAA
jgi:hypothetical protein